MKSQIFLAVLVFSNFVLAEQVTNKSESTWNATSLTDETIKKIQQSQFLYKKCVTDEMQKEGYSKIESRTATDAIIKQCEPVLATMRKKYLAVKVPGIVADRHLKKMRIDITRRVLKQMMFAEASRKAGK